MNSSLVKDILNGLDVKDNLLRDGLGDDALSGVVGMNTAGLFGSKEY